ncbi:hypothetical protein DFH27DRAFT_523728 [Peziza echinospora]|nr:hypothetical protein DFH27DRAFT_523728 [Peziza echinospora]
MRSSIACARCRRSKVKCVNSGVHTTCKACESSGRDCVYPVPGGGGQQILATSGGDGSAAATGISGSGRSGATATGGHASATGATSAEGGAGAAGASSGGLGPSAAGSGSGASASASRPRAPKKPTVPGTPTSSSTAAVGGTPIGTARDGGISRIGIIGGNVLETSFTYGGSGGSSKSKGSGGGAAASTSPSAVTTIPILFAHIHGALIDGTGIPAAEEVLNDPSLTWQFWTNMHDHYKHHFSAELPFLHAPTFLSPNRLPKLPSQHVLPRVAATTEDRTSYPLCLGILTLMGRFYPPLIKLHQAYAQSAAPAPAPTVKSGKGSSSSAAAIPPSEGRRIGEFYAAILRKHLFGPSIPSGRDVEVAQPTIEKVQALLMLAVHEWIGEGKVDRAMLWVGLAAKMANILGLGRSGAGSTSPADDESAVSADDHHPSGDQRLNGAAADAEDSGAARKRRKLSSPGSGPNATTLVAGEAKEKEKKELVIQDEIARRTFWSIFMLDRALVRGPRSELSFRLEDINGSRKHSADEFEYPEDEEEGFHGDRTVKLPCNDAAFLFGQKVKTDVLRIGGYTGSSDIHSNPPNTAGTEGQTLTEADTIWQIGEKEAELSRIIRGMEIWGRVRRWKGAYSQHHSPPTKATIPPPPPHSFKILKDLIQTYSSPLPANLLFSPDNLNAHIHSKSSTSYATIHVINFLSRMVLNRHNMPFIPDLTHPIPAHTSDSAKEIFRSARGVFQLVKGLTDWNVGVETPLVGYAVYVAGYWAVYAAAWPTLDDQEYLAPPPGTTVEENTNIQIAISQLKRFTARWCLGGGDGKRWSNGLLRLDEFYRRHKASTSGSPNSGSYSSKKANGFPGSEGKGKPSPEEYLRFQRMFFGLGRDEVAGWVEPAASSSNSSHAGGSHGSNLAPPTHGHSRRASGDHKKRVSPQPPHPPAAQPQPQHTSTNTSTTTTTSGKANDRWIAINKSPSGTSTVNVGTANVAPQPTSPERPYFSSSSPNTAANLPTSSTTSSSTTTTNIIQHNTSANNNPSSTNHNANPSSSPVSSSSSLHNMNNNIPAPHVLIDSILPPISHVEGGGRRREVTPGTSSSHSHYQSGQSLSPSKKRGAGEMEVGSERERDREMKRERERGSGDEGGWGGGGHGHSHGHGHHGHGQGVRVAEGED